MFCQDLKFYFIFFETEYHFCCPGWSAKVRSHNNLRLSGSSDSPALASRVAGIIGAHQHTRLIFLFVFVFLVETEFRPVGQASFELLTSGDPPTSASKSAGITGVSHPTLPRSPVFLVASSASLLP